jgi:hypothetical protein
MVWKVGRVVLPLFLLMAFPVDFFFSRSSIFQENDVTKILGHLTSERPLKVKNMQNQENLLHNVKTK